VARIRTIKPSLWASEKLGRLSTLARLNFIGLISLADDEGRGRGATRFLIGQLHPYADNVSEKDFESSLLELQAAKLVAFFTVEGCRYYALPGWRAHQRIDRPQDTAIPDVPIGHTMKSLFDDHSTNARRTLDDHSSEERKGTEGNGLEGNGKQPLDSSRKGFLTAAEVKGLELPYPIKGAYFMRRVGDLEPSYCQWALDHLHNAGPELRRALGARVKQGNYEKEGARS
jgi:hypothetical protein